MSFDHYEGDNAEDAEDGEDWISNSNRTTFISQLFDKVYKRDDEVTLDETVWSSLPEDELFMVLRRLPPAAIGRFRCVSTGWNLTLSSLSLFHTYRSNETAGSSCTVMIGGGDAVAFFCHADHKWFKFPIRRPPPAPLNFIADVSAGLFCYEVARHNSMQLCVSNPTLGYCQVLPPYCYRPRELLNRSQMLKLLVDREAKTFKVVALVPTDPPATVVFDSKTCTWSVFASYPAMDTPSIFFVCRNIIYAFVYTFGNTTMFCFEGNRWNSVQAQLPCKTGLKFFIGSGKDEVLVVQLNSSEKDPVCVWKWRDGAEGDSADFTLARWEAIPIEVDENVRPILEEMAIFEWKCFCHGKEYFCLVTSDMDSTFRGLKYTIATKSWSAIPCPVGWTVPLVFGFECFGWEPDSDNDVELSKEANIENYFTEFHALPVVP